MIRRLSILTAWLLLAVSARADTVTPNAGWIARPILVQGDSVAAIAGPGYPDTFSHALPDGLGVWQSGESIFIAINHETTPAHISLLQIPRAGLIAALDDPAQDLAGLPDHISYAYRRVRSAEDGSVLAGEGSALSVLDYANAHFRRFCSGTSWPAASLGGGRGFSDALYLTGEEVSGGRFYALDLASRDLWLVPALGEGSWENAALLDTGESDHVALLLMSDVGSGSGDYLRLYVGRKQVDANLDGQIDFLERNGLAGGTVYYYHPDAPWSATDLPDGNSSGYWSASSDGALRETKMEDAHTNPANGRQIVFAASHDGVYILESTLHITAEGLDTGASPVSLRQVIDDDFPSPIEEPDNVFWAEDGLIYIEEDGAGNDIWRLTTAGAYTRIGRADSEPSGIVDISPLLNRSPGDVLLTSLQGGGTRGSIVLLQRQASERREWFLPFLLSIIGD